MRLEHSRRPPHALCDHVPKLCRAPYNACQQQFDEHGKVWIIGKGLPYLRINPRPRDESAHNDAQEYSSDWTQHDQPPQKMPMRLHGRSASQAPSAASAAMVAAIKPALP